MKKGLIFFSIIVFLTLSMTCQKKSTDVLKGDGTEGEVVITYNKIDRNDIPPPPDTAWWTLDTSNLDYCQQRIWDYLKTMYPTNEENYWDYNVYSIMDEPSDIWRNRAFISQYTHFFIDTLYSNDGILFESMQACDRVDSTFFLQALGQPTCKSYNNILKQSNYFYFFKLRFRHGPCVHIFDAGEQYEQYCYPYHFQYCAQMKVRFSQETGKAVYIDFLGSG